VCRLIHLLVGIRVTTNSGSDCRKVLPNARIEDVAESYAAVEMWAKHLFFSDSRRTGEPTDRSIASCEATMGPGA
jgi:hypothetical protein